MILFICDHPAKLDNMNLALVLSTTKIITTADEVREVKGSDHIEIVTSLAKPEAMTPDQVTAIKLAILSNASIVVQAATEMTNRMNKTPPSSIKPLLNPAMRSHE